MAASEPQIDPTGELKPKRKRWRDSWRDFWHQRGVRFVRTVTEAKSEDEVRAFLALWLVIVLLLLVLVPPSGRDDLVASSKTLAIAVIAFYFGLHKGTPHTPGPEQEKPSDKTRD